MFTELGLDGEGFLAGGFDNLLAGLGQLTFEVGDAGLLVGNEVGLIKARLGFFPLGDACVEKGKDTTEAGADI
jgi:hypothetical protein